MSYVYDGRAPALLFPSTHNARKEIPLHRGLVAYFPLALIAVAKLSKIGNDQHNPGKPLHWDRSKSGDEADALLRHLFEIDGIDEDGVPHVVKCAWRGLSLCQKYFEEHLDQYVALTETTSQPD